jgi:hypothetical protein
MGKGQVLGDPTAVVTGARITDPLSRRVPLASRHFLAFLIALRFSPAHATSFWRLCGTEDGTAAEIGGATWHSAALSGCSRPAAGRSGRWRHRHEARFDRRRTHPDPLRDTPTAHRLRCRCQWRISAADGSPASGRCSATCNSNRQWPAGEWPHGCADCAACPDPGTHFPLGPPPNLLI